MNPVRGILHTLAQNINSNRADFLKMTTKNFKCLNWKRIILLQAVDENGIHNQYY